MINREENDNVLFVWYEQLLHFRNAKSFVSDIHALSVAIDHFSPQLAKVTLKIYVNKYKEPLNTVGKHLTGIVTLKRRNAYVSKSQDQLGFELHYVMRCIILFGAVAVGLVPSLYAAVEMVKQDGVNLNALNLYE